MATAFALPVLEPFDLDDHLAANGAKSLLRFLTCGSVDDGKSTLIGRLLYDSEMLFDDQLATLAEDSRRSGTQGQALDLALLVDGLAAEREQGITIDVAYRSFATAKRKFIVADTPGHEQYTRNMVTGASTADLAVILVDARKGVLTQTRRHSHLVHLLGIRRLVLAVNKMDLVGYDQARFEEVVSDYRAFASVSGMATPVAIPMSGLTGDNVAAPTTAMPWYRGPSLLEHLETVSVSDPPAQDAPFRMAVQWVNRPHAGFRGYAGAIAGGAVRRGDAVVLLPSGVETKVERILGPGGDQEIGIAGQSVTLTFATDVDCSRGDLIASPATPPPLTRSLEATLVWMAEEALAPGRAYWLKLGTLTLTAAVASVAEIVDVDAGERRPGRPLRLNDIGLCRIDLDRPAPATPYAQSRRLGGFILIDKASHATVAAGMIRSAGDDARSAASDGARDRNGGVLWVRGVSASARSATARTVVQRLEALGRPVLLLDASVMRSGLGSDLRDGREDEAEALRRAREVARLVSRAGVHVLIDMDAPGDQAHPGRTIEAADIDELWSPDWMI